METVTQLGQRDAVTKVSSPIPGKLMGLAIVSLVPALFWTGVLALIGPLIGITFDLNTLVMVGIVIALFLSVVFSALSLSSGGTT